MTPLTEWFDTEVKRWRSGAAILWTLILIIPFSFIFALNQSFYPYDLVSWLTGILFFFINLTFWTSVFGILFLVFVIARFNIRYYCVYHCIPSNRLQWIWSLLSSLCFLNVICHMTCAGVITWLATRIMGGHFMNLVVPTVENADVNVLNEYHVFVVLHGIFVGAVYGVTFFMSGSDVIQFPIIQQTKFFQVKGQLVSMLRTSAWRSFRNMKYFYVLYYLFLSSTVRSWSSIDGAFKRDESSDSVGLDTVSGLMSLSLAYNVWFCGMFVDFLLSLPHLLYTVYQTQPLEFSIEATAEVPEYRCLSEVLGCDSHPLLQYLACLDLSRLAKHSPERRGSIFCVTPLGGHPLNWTNVSSAALSQLKAFLDQIIECNDYPTGRKALQKPADGNLQSKPAMIATVGAPEQDLTYRGPTTGPPTLYWLIPSGESPLKKERKLQPERLKKAISAFFKKLSEIMKAHPVVSYFVADRPEFLSLKLFSKSQKYIWLIDGLSHLAAASFKEDKYGVVQATLPEILTVFLSLLETLNRHLKQFPVRKNNRVDHVNIQSLKMALKEAIKEAIYRIVITFDTHLSSVPLSADHSRRLQMFREFKE